VFVDAGNLIDVDVAVYLPNRVILRESKGRLYLVLDTKAGFQVIKPDTADYNSLLFSLVNLVKPNTSKYSFKELMELITPETATRWIKEKGFPEIECSYLIDNLGIIKGWEVENKKSQEFGSRIWLSLSRFRRQLVTLYLLFHLWQGLLYESEQKITICLQALAAEDISGLSFEQKKITAQQFLSGLIEQRIQKMQPRFSAYLPYPKIILHTDSLFTAAYFQLACLITQGEKDGKHLKMCPKEEGGCGNLFWGHGNRKFCPLCDRRTAYSRRKKKEKTVNKSPLALLQ